MRTFIKGPCQCLTKALFFLFIFFPCVAFPELPETAYLTLTQDPSSSMSVHWIEKQHHKQIDALFYQKKGEAAWKKALYSASYTFGLSPYRLKELVLEELEAGAEYLFRFDGQKKIYGFRTLSLDRALPLKVAIGGDCFESKRAFARVSAVLAAKDPDFAVLGGDIAYACGYGFSRGKHGSMQRWVSFFRLWQKHMIGKEGRMIPIAALPGNHDVTSKDRREEGVNSFFLQLFPSKEGRTYKSFQIGQTLAFILLDTGHIAPIEEGQKRWLEASLEAFKDVLWKIPVYHIAAYPSFYHPEDKVPSLIRRAWAPLFEKYGVRLVFENHNHSFKRTYPMWEGKIASKGIVYIGDGGWGAFPRKSPSPQEGKDFFYLAKQEDSTCASLLTIEEKKLKIETFNMKKQCIDIFEIK